MTTSIRELARAKAAETVISGVALTGCRLLGFRRQVRRYERRPARCVLLGFTTDIGVHALITAAKAKLVKLEGKPGMVKKLERAEKA